MSWSFNVAERPSVSPRLSETMKGHSVQVLPIAQQAHPEPRNISTSQVDLNSSHRLEDQPSNVSDYSPIRESVDTTTARQLDYITLMEQDCSWSDDQCPDSVWALMESSITCENNPMS